MILEAACDVTTEAAVVTEQTTEIHLELCPTQEMRRRLVVRVVRSRYPYIWAGVYPGSGKWHDCLGFANGDVAIAHVARFKFRSGSDTLSLCIGAAQFLITEREAARLVKELGLPEKTL